MYLLDEKNISVLRVLGCGNKSRHGETELWAEPSILNIRLSKVIPLLPLGISEFLFQFLRKYYGIKLIMATWPILPFTS